MIVCFFSDYFSKNKFFFEIIKKTFNSKSLHMQLNLVIQVVFTIKIGDKERFAKEQIGAMVFGQKKTAYKCI